MSCMKVKYRSGKSTQQPVKYWGVCRDAEVLSLFATIINKLQGLMEKEVPRIFEAVFEVTLTMITKNFEVHCQINSPILRV